MNKKGPIIVIENKQEDRKLFIEVFLELNYANQIIYFNEADTAAKYLLRHEIKPFLVFSDIVLLNVMNYKIVESNPDKADMMFNCPYLFFTTLFEQSFIIDPYSIPTQSYFIKPYDYTKFKGVIRTIIEYWLAYKPLKKSKKAL
ncbi:response regulator [Flavobacterium sp. FlaQc-48]|uniref:response regulator n=1 Tax=Flavobacterium sp. FlaQc-48 TaxID=3374181 RepID=UPI0037569B7B